VVVRTVAATVNPTDLLFRSGQQAASMASLSPPYVPGMEFAGYVDQVGDAVTRLHVGQSVMGVVDPRRPAGGAQAEFVVVPEASVVPVPEGMDLAEAATLPMNGLTALVALDLLEASPGDVVLVTGAAGAVGGYVVQLAATAGLTVVADAKEADVSLVRALGADHVVPRGGSMASAVRELLPEGVHCLVDAARIGPEANAVVRDGGVVVAVRRSDEADERLRYRYVTVPEHVTDTAALERLADLVDAGRLTPRVALRLPMDQAAEAHRLLEKGGLRGRVVLDLR
jgi:NADPH:quinone reductase-like Zn-dependent oxidoreductase